MARVLIIDDDPSLRRALRLGLGAAHHEVITAGTAAEGITQAAIGSPDVIVLDLGLPDSDGLTVCKQIRQWSDVPIVVLSAADAEGRKVAALDGGADDYVTKPFGMAELEARLRTAMRHRRSEQEQGSGAISIGSLSLDPLHHEARIDGEILELTAKDFDVLLFLARHTGKLCTHEMILGAVWGSAYKKEAQYLHAYVHRLRQKLGGDHVGLLIKSTPGIGYSLVEGPSDQSDA